MLGVEPVAVAGVPLWAVSSRLSASPDRGAWLGPNSPEWVVVFTTEGSRPASTLVGHTGY